MKYPKLKINTKIYSDYTNDGTEFILANVVRQFKAYQVKFADKNEKDELFIPNSNQDSRQEVETSVLECEGTTRWKYAEQDLEEEDVAQPVIMKHERLEEDDLVELEFDIGKEKKKWYSGVVIGELDAFLIHFHKEMDEDKDEYAFLIQFPEENHITRLYTENEIQFRKVEYDENNEDHRHLTLRRFKDNCAKIDEHCEALKEEVALCEKHLLVLNRRIASIESQEKGFSQEMLDEETLTKSIELVENMKKSTERLMEALAEGLVVKLDAQEEETLKSQFRKFLERKKVENFELILDSYSKYFQGVELGLDECSHLKTILQESFFPMLNANWQKISKKLEYIKCKRSYMKVKNISDSLKDNIIVQKEIKKEMELAISKEASETTNKKRVREVNDTPSQNKRARGRPKRDVDSPSVSLPTKVSPGSGTSKKKGRGRPRKDASPAASTSSTSLGVSPKSNNSKKKGRGRPRKKNASSTESSNKRGRPRKNTGVYKSPMKSLSNQDIFEIMHPYSPDY